MNDAADEAERMARAAADLERTTDLVLAALDQDGGWVTGKELEADTGLGQLEVTRAVNHLVSTRQVSAVRDAAAGDPLLFKLTRWHP